MSANWSGKPKADWKVWTGRVLSGLVVAFLLLDGFMKLIPATPVIETSAQMGWPTEVTGLRMLGVVLLASTLLYAIPRTSILGAVLLTGYLGGAVATHVRIHDPLFSHVLFGVYIGLLLWGGLYLRNRQLRELLPLRRAASGSR